MVQATPHRSVIWTPNPGPQTAYIQGQSLWGIVYGGAAGGGKTYGSLGDWLFHWQQYGGNVYGGFFRRKLTDLEYCIGEAKRIYLPLGATWKEQKKRFEFPDGATLVFRHLETWDDVLAMMSTQFTRIYFEELTHWPTDEAFRAMRSRLRSPHGIPTSWRATCNPGGPGHNWVKEYAIDPAPAGYQPIDDHGQQFTFIPAKVADNPHLGDDYVLNLRSMGSDALVQKYLEGDWSVIDGAFFDCWSSRRHVVRPFAIPEDWLKFRSIDWGSAAPFSVGWWAVAPDDTPLDDGRTLPRGCLVRYREWYGKEKANKGLKLPAEEVARGIVSRETEGETFAFSVCDPAMRQSDGGPSIVERMYKAAGIVWRPGDNKRVASRGALGGWDMMRARMMGEADDRPMIVCFSTCTDSIRTIPALQHDENRAEDVDTDGEDHAADEWRYACMSRPWIPPAVKDYNAIEAATAPPTFEAEVRAWEQRTGGRDRI